MLSFVEAGLGSRSLAFVLDLLIRVLVMLGVILALAVIQTTSSTLLVIVYTVTTFVLVLVYPVAFELALRGRTPGKLALGLRVVTIEGGPVRFRHAAIRSGLGLVDFVISSGVVAVVVSLLNRRSQRVGDVVAGTMVIRERSALRPSTAIVFAPPPGWEAFAAGLDTSALTGETAVLIRSFLLRADSLGADARWRLGYQLAGWIAVRIGTTLPAHTHPEAFLIAVTAAHQASHAAPMPAPAPTSGPTGHVPAPVFRADDLSPTWGT